MSERTPSQTVGPFLHIGLAPADYNFRVLFGSSLAGPGVAGVPIEIEGAIRDGEGNALPDALVEIWQADSDGRYPHPADGRPVRSNSFRGFGRAATDAAGQFHFATVKPGAVPAPGGGLQAPHINVGIFARGLLKRLFTRIYFAGEALNAGDPILALVPEDRRHTLMAQPDTTHPGRFRFDIRLQGADETVFFDA
ncbi:MAG TPA: protocatechuate 3,4-dioxygenase subunit alpha [Hyphomicrobiaceae bacterium]|nr:protocatechuate 3,4-dioxygenase subunit alpha [Hyphomicrobiaceae bacterium]